MIPSLVAAHLADDLVDYITATLDFSDPGFRDAFEAHLRDPNKGLFRGPYLRLGLPFETADPDAPSPLEIAPPFTPYAHQLQAFEQLSTRGTARNTLVTTGTGSGKTECFLYPLLDHVHRNKHRRGVQAIVIYPMNALATDQARRLAEILASDDRLKDIRAGIYVGGEARKPTAGDTSPRLIEDKKELRRDPPHILLTNYKMLDFMLLRPNERELWSHDDDAHPLRFLVLDELHTFDGAQGSDVACLIRRLKHRLGLPDGHLTCAGTSATIGSATDPATFQRLADFAAELFDEPFRGADVVREQRLSRVDFVRPAGSAITLPTVDDPADLDARTTDLATWLEATQRLWFGGDPTEDPVALGERLLAHPLLHALLDIAADRPTAWTAIDRQLGKRITDWEQYPGSHRRAMIDSFLALVSRARRRVGTREVPLLTVQSQLWARELTRLLRRLPVLEHDALPPAEFAWWTDVPGAVQPDGMHAPQAHCRECGLHGLAAEQSDAKKQRGLLGFAPGRVGESWFRQHRDARFVQLLPDAASATLKHWLDARSGAVSATRPSDPSGQTTGAPIEITTPQTNNKNNRAVFHCPRCDARDSLRIVGSRAASLLSVAVTHLYQTDAHDEPKLLAFTDAVQDACHRAGFFGARTYRIHLRTAIRSTIADDDPLPLADAARAFARHWRDGRSKFAYVADVLPHDLRDLPEYTAFVAQGGKGRHRSLDRILTDRIAWEIHREFGVASVFGRSLERTGAAVCQVDPQRLAIATERFDGWIRGEGLHAGDYHPAHFLLGLVHRLRQMGGILHPFLDLKGKSYLRGGGKPYLLSKRMNPHISPQPPGTRRVRFVASKRTESFPSPFGPRAGAGWFGDWMDRALNWRPVGAEMHQVYTRALQALVDAEILKEVKGNGQLRLWGLDPDALELTTCIAALRADGPDSHVVHLGEHEAAIADGKPAFAYRSAAELARVSPEPGFYARVYARGTSTRVFPGEHTGLLERGERETLEERFIAGATPEDPHAPNLLVCTPTLEMGVDIGDLSAVLLCSVPPGPSNYLQRVGRAGRATGNAMVFTLANATPHDQYFHTEPTRMLAGHVEPPGVFLQAVSMLQRQLTAYCMDAWSRDDLDADDLPPRTQLVLSEKGRARFPGRFVTYLRDHADDLAASFLGLFGAELPPHVHHDLTAWVTSPNRLARRLDDAFDAVARQIAEYQRERKKAKTRFDKIAEDPTAYPDADVEMADLRRYRAVLAHLIEELRHRYPLNVLTDASLLPNYAFPESGVELHAMLGGREADAEEGAKRTYEKRSYKRPAARALRELAPFNTFYADGHKMQVTQLELGPKAERIEHWRLCPTCHHTERAVDPATPTGDTSCPSCGEPNWIGKAQVRAMLPMTTVRSVSDRVRSTTADDSEEREQKRYHLVQVYEIPPDVEGFGTLLPGFGFGFEYLERLDLTELNVGLQAADPQAPKVHVAGEEASEEGFLTCGSCGTVLDPFEHRDEAKKRAHTPFCPQKGKNGRHTRNLYLFRHLSSEALRFLLPYSELDVESRRRSFEAAIAFGLRSRFRGQPMHLQTSLMSEPDAIDATVRRHFVVLMDAVPGGTGYLRDFREPDAVFALLAETLTALRSCPCRKEGRDGCYRCLFAHQARRHLPVLSSARAEAVLSGILDRRSHAERVPSPIPNGRGQRVEDVQGKTIEGRLEPKFVAALQERYGHRFRELRMDKAWEILAGDTTWRLDAQVDLTEEAGRPCRADFVFTGQSGPGQDRRVVVECDGFAYHAQPDLAESRLPADFQKRSNLASRPGVQIWSLVWKDFQKDSPEAPPLIGAPAATWRASIDKNPALIPPALQEVGRRLPTARPLELLFDYLDHPGADWARLVTAYSCIGLAVDAGSGRSLDTASQAAVTRHLRDAAAVSPLPPLALQRPTSTTHPWPTVRQGDDTALALWALPAVIAAPDPGGLFGVLRLDMRHQRREKEGYEASWRSFLATLNLLQFVPGVEVVWEIAAEEAPDQDAADAVLEALGIAEPSLAAEPARPHYDTSSADEPLRAVLEHHDPAIHPVITHLRGRGLPLPDAIPDDVADGLACAARWSTERVAVVWNEPYPEEWTWAETHDWRLFASPPILGDLETALSADGASRVSG